MGVKIVCTGAGARLEPSEIELIAAAAREHGRATLLVPTFAARDAAYRELAQAGVGLGVEVATPATWIAALWELFGDGRRLAGNFERQALIAALLDASEPSDIAPLRNNPGTVRMLARMVRDLAPYAGDEPRPGLGGGAAGPLTEADDMVLDLLQAYRAAAAARGFVEASEASESLVRTFDGNPPACLRAVAVRDVCTVPAYLQRLAGLVARGGAAGEGEVVWLLGAGQERFGRDLETAFAQAGCPVEQEDLAFAARARAAASPAPAAKTAPAASSAAPAFLEVAGPHAKQRAYAEEALRLLAAPAPAEVAQAADAVAPAGVAQAAPAEVAFAHPRPTEAFFELAPRLAAGGARATVRARVSWRESMAGRQFAALVDVAARMDEAGGDPLRAGEWWPAPELTDWLYCPLSGVDAGYARAFDKDVRGHRAYSGERVGRKLQSVQSRQLAARAELDAGHPYAGVPAVCADVWQAVCAKRPVSALKAMLEVARALPASAFGGCDGRARQQLECSLLQAALDAVGPRAHELGVSQGAAITVLDSLQVMLELEAGPAAAGAGQGDASGRPAPGCVRFMRLDEAALLPAGGVRGLLLADCDGEHYPLKRDESLETVLAERLGRAPLAMEPAARQRTQFQRALAVPVQPAVLARVTHDGQARDRYPAAMWTELRMAAGDGGAASRVRSRGEGDIVADLDRCSGAGLRIERVSCLPPQELTERAAGYLLPTERAGRDQGAPLVPRRLSASQIESYCTCPLCWFMGSRVRPSALDAGFGGMEEGNFVHDVMARFHARLAEEGVARVVPENVDASLELLETVFAEVRAEHARGKTSSSAPLVALSTLEAVQIDEILPLLRNVVRYEADALPPYHPALLEYSFDGQGISYAGRPLGGRIDRVDVDGRGRAVVIDYKHRDNPRQFQLSDPVELDAETGEARLPTPDWLPEHQQALIYAQALRRTGAPLDTRGALYFSTKRHPAMCGAVDFGLVSMVPGMRDGFPGGGSELGMTFDELLDCVEDEVGRRLDALEAGRIQASPEQPASCGYNHALGFEMREA